MRVTGTIGRVPRRPEICVEDGGDVVAQDAAVPRLCDRELDGEAFERWGLVARQCGVVSVDAELVRPFELALLRAVEDDGRTSSVAECLPVQVTEREHAEGEGEAGLHVERVRLRKVVDDGAEGRGRVNRHEVRRGNRHDRRHAAVAEVDPLGQRIRARVLDGLDRLPLHGGEGHENHVRAVDLERQVFDAELGDPSG